MSSTLPSDDTTTAASPTTNSSAAGALTTPLLSDQPNSLSRTPSLRAAARFLRRASSRRMMREPSVRVREAAAEQIEERQTDWAYSKPIVVLDLVWNLAFVTVSVLILIVSREERPSLPLRVWILGYCVQCVVHMVCVCVECRRRWEMRLEESYRSGRRNGGWSSGNSSGSDGGEYVDYSSERQANGEEIRYMV